MPADILGRQCHVIGDVAAVYSNLELSARDLADNAHEYMEKVLRKLTEDEVDAFPRL